MLTALPITRGQAPSRLSAPISWRPRETWGAGWAGRVRGSWDGRAHSTPFTKTCPPDLQPVCPCACRCLFLAPVPGWPDAGGLQGFSLISVDYRRPVKMLISPAPLSRSPKSTSPPGRTRLPQSQLPQPHSTCSQRAAPPSSPATALEAKAGAPCLLQRRRVSVAGG